MENQNTQKLAEQIARLLQTNEKESDDFLRSSFENINRRLDKIELQLAPKTQRSALSTQHSLHPSQEKLASLEELAGEIISNLQNEKACPFEPTGKPCDNCSMCNSRGF